MDNNTHPKTPLYPLNVEVSDHTYTAFAVLSETTGQSISVLVRAILDEFVQQVLVKHTDH